MVSSFSKVIATQGPTSFTTPHFFQMILDHKVDVIVMLTKEKERASDGERNINISCSIVSICLCVNTTNRKFY